MVQHVVTTERASLVVSELQAGTVMGSHKHEADEIGTVVRGQLVMVVAGEQRILNTGDSYRVRANTAHGARVLNEATTVVSCYSPPLDDLRKAFEQQNVPRGDAG